MLKSEGRLSFMEKQLAALGLPYEHVIGVDGKSLDAGASPIDEEQFLLMHRRYPSAGEAGCAASHRLCWQKLIQGDDPLALVLEDDVTLSDNLPEILSRLEGMQCLDFINLSSSGSYDDDAAKIERLLALGQHKRPYVFGGNRKLWRSLEWSSWKIFEIMPVIKDVFLMECDPAPALGSGYVLSKKSAGHFLKSTEKLSCPVDYAWRETYPMLRQGFCSPQVVIQSLGDSTIEGRDSSQTLTFPQNFLRFFLKLKRYKRKLARFFLYYFRAI